jgi:hypothetical protein
MKTELFAVIGEIIELLRACNWPDKAAWFLQKQDLLSKLSLSDEEFKEFKRELFEIEKIMTGMGSFSDLPLYPPQESGLSEKQAAEKQWRLANQLTELIRKIGGVPNRTA